MCWFHVMINVKKRKNLIPAASYHDVLDDIRSLHLSSSETQFDKKLKVVLKKWKKLEIDEFKDYFLKQWVNGVFNKWCIYHTPAGFSSGNNPVES